MFLWLDDIRDPALHGHIGWTWVKSGPEAIEAFQTGTVTRASLDHDLTVRATLGYWEGEFTGYDLLLWIEQHPEFWPGGGVDIHSINPFGRSRMQSVLDRIKSRR